MTPRLAVSAPCTASVYCLVALEGDEVCAEEELMKLESMKVLIDVLAPQAGRVVKVHVQEGELVDQGSTLVELEVEEAA